MSAALAEPAIQKLSAAAPGRSAFAIQKLSGARRADAIEVERLGLGATISELCAQAGVSPATYHRHVVAGGCRPAALAKLEKGLAALRQRGRRHDAPLIRATYGGFLVAVARESGLAPSAVHAQDPRRGATADPAWRAIAHVRQAALYLTITALALQQRSLAEALGLTPAAVCLALGSVEDRRDDPAFDALLDRLAGEVMGNLP